MQITKINQHNKNISSTTNFKGFYNNKILLKGLNFASENGAVFAAATTVFLSTFVRPFAILATPKANVENKQYACAKSVSSSIINLGIITAITAPIVSAIKNIENSPEKFLTQKTINNLKYNSHILNKSKSFRFSTQLFKLSSSFLSAIPKAYLTTILIAPIMSHFFKQNSNAKSSISFSGTSTNSSLYRNTTQLISNGFSKILNNEKFQNFAKKHQNTSLAQHIFSLNDIFLTGLFIKFTKTNKNIKENRKKTLIYNAGISTALTIIGGYGVNKLLDKPTELFISKFKNANKSLKNVEKYIDGIKNAKASLVLGGLYYIITPIVATMLAEICTKGNKYEN